MKARLGSALLFLAVLAIGGWTVYYFWKTPSAADSVAEASAAAPLELHLRAGLRLLLERDDPRQSQDAHGLNPRLARRLPFGPCEIEPDLSRLRRRLLARDGAFSQSIEIEPKSARDVEESIRSLQDLVGTDAEARIRQQARSERLRFGDA